MRSFLRRLGAVLGAALTTILDAGCVEGAADDVIAHTGQILDPAPADQNHGVLLQVVADTWDVGRHLEARGQADTGHLAQSRVGLLRGGGVDPRADPPALRTGPQRWGFGLAEGALPLGADQLLDGGHLGPEVGRRADRIRQSTTIPENRSVSD